MRNLSLHAALATALLLLPGLHAAAAVPTEGATLQAHDWVMACDNTRTCRAAGYGPQGTITFSVLLERAAGADAAVSALLVFADADMHGDGPGDPGAARPGDGLRLRTAGKDAGALPPMEDQTAVALTRSQVSAVVDALRAQAPVEIIAGAGTAWPISVRGATSVLAAMDSAQGRAGTVTALIAPGTTPASAVPAAVTAPRLGEAPVLAATRAQDAQLAVRDDLRQALLATLGADAPCADLAGQSRPPSLHVERLGATQVLASMTCHWRTHDVVSGHWVLRDATPWRPTQVTLSGARFLRDSGTLSMESDDRDAGRCFSGRDWQWDGQRFVLRLAYVTGLCRGAPGGLWRLATYLTRPD